MEEQEGGDAVDWREAFDDLLVFEQDFDTAMQILMFQDEKVARLSLEEPSLTMRRTGRRAKSRTSARSSSKKRRRTEASEAAREEPPIPPLGSCTQSSGLWSSVANSAEEEEATQAPWTQQYSSVEMQEYAAPQFDEAYEDVGAPGTGETGGKPSETGRNARVNGAATTAVSSSDGANREKGNSSVGTSPTAVSSLFQTRSGKVATVSSGHVEEVGANVMFEGNNVEVAANLGECFSAQNREHKVQVTTGALTVNSQNLQPDDVDFSKASGPAYFPDDAENNAAKVQYRCHRVSTIGKNNSGATVSSLFQTAAGDTVAISKARLTDYTEKLFKELSPDPQPLQTTTVTNPHHANRCHTMASTLFTTGSGKAVSVSKVRLQAYEAKLRSEEEMVAASTTSERRDVHGAGGGVNAKADSAATVPSLFQTGSGKAVSVSKVRLQAYEAKLRSEEEMVAASTTSERRDVHGAGGGVNAKADSAATVPSLFQTGSGKAVSVSKVRLQAYEAKLRSEEEMVAASTTSERRDVHGAGGGVNAKADSAATVPSLFQTGSGKAVSVSKVRLQAYEAKLRSEEEMVAASTTSERRDVHGAGGGVNAKADSAATVPSLFQTGSGKAVSVSKVRLQAYEAKLRSEEEMVAASTTSERRDVHGAGGGVNAKADSAATVPSLFQTGSGKAVSVSKVRLQAYEAKLRSEEEMVAASTTSERRDVHGAGGGVNAKADSAATVPSLFQTGSGKAVSVSKVRLQAYEAKLRSEEEMVAASTTSERRDVHGAGGGVNAKADSAATVPSLFQTGSGKAVSVSKVRLQAYEAKLRSEEEMVAASTTSERRDVHGAGGGVNAKADSAATVPSLFQTGSGKAVSVSKVRLQAYEAKLRSEEEMVAASTTSERRDVHGAGGGVNAKADSAATVPSLFQTGSGKAVSVSKVRLQAYEAKLRSEEEMVAASTTSERRDVHGAGGGVNAKADSAATVPSLFQTGSGKAVSVSKVRLQAYEAKLRSEEEMVAASTTSERRDVHGAGGGVNAKADSAATVPSLFQTGSGKAVSVSKVRLQAYEAKLRSEEEMVAASTTSERRDVHGAGGGVNAKADSAATVPSLFQTGSGKAVSVSKVRLQAYEAKLRSEEEMVAASTTSERRDVHGAGGGVNAKADSAATVPSLFQTGSGKAVSVSKVRLQAYEAKLRSEEEMVAASTTSERRDVHGAGGGVNAKADSAATVPSLFQTGSGKAVSVSKVRLQAYEAKLRSEEEMVAASTTSERRDVHGAGGGVNAKADSAATVPSLFQTGSGKAVSVSKVRLQAYEAKLRSEEEMVAASTTSERRDVHGAGGGVNAKADSAATVPSLFQTGSGKAVSVSKVRLQAYEAKLRSEEEPMSDEGRGAGSVSGDIEVKVSRSGLRNMDSEKVSGSSTCTRVLVNRQVSEIPRIARGSGGPIISDRATTFQPRQGQGLNGRDKENVHPENVLIRKTAALEASKASRPTLCSTQLNSRLTGRYPQHQATRQHMTAKRAVQLSTSSQSRVGGKKRFHPPVASKKLRVIDAQGLKDVRYRTVPTSKKQKVARTEPQPFIYNEAMKISFPVLVGLHEDHTLPADGWELSYLQVLNTITAANAADVGFTHDGDLVNPSERSYDSTVFIGPRELYCQLKAGVHILETTGATFAWFLNHYRWIVWKLAAMERLFPRLLLKQYLTKDQVAKQITHRYQRDLNNAERSILKKILHRDASSVSCMVLCIAALLPFPTDNNNSIDQELPACWNMSLVLTDGWYSVYAVPDAPLAAMLWKSHAKSSLVGTKIVTWNAGLQNSTEGIDPLECAIVRESQWKNPLLAKEDLTQWPYLLLRYNSTRRARFETRLGVEKLHFMIPTNPRARKQQPQLTFSMLKSVPLKSLEVGGGMVRSVRIRVTRISPVLHLQANEWTLGPRILCEEQLPTYFQLRSEYGRASMQRKIQQHGVGSGAEDWLNDDQIDVPPPIPFIKMDVECTHPSNGNQGVGCGILTVWRPSEELLSSGLREGAEYFASSLTVNWKVDGGRGQDAFVRLGSTKHSGFEEVHDDLSLDDKEAKGTAQLKRNQRVCVDVQQATTDYRANFESDRRNERRPTIDVCVCVVLVTTRETQDGSSIAAKRQAEVSLLDPTIKPKESRYVEHVFVTDKSRHLMSIRVSGMEVSMLKKKTSPLKRGSSSSFAFRRGSKRIWKEGAVLCLSGLEVSHYDEQLRVLDCVLVESTQIVSFPSKNSPFWNHFQCLQREAGISTSRRSASEPTSSEFFEELAHLKKYVERDILRMDFVPSQECDEHYVEVVEQERLTQDLQAHEGGGEQTNESSGTVNRHLRWDGTVVKILPLPGSSKFIFPRNVIALVCICIRTDDNAFRSVYLTQEAVISMQALLQGTDVEKQLSLKEGGPTEDDAALVLCTMKMLNKTNADKTFQFEVRQATNERLINSWKPWDRLHASYWVANTVTSAPPPTD